MKIKKTLGLKEAVSGTKKPTAKRTALFRGTLIPMSSGQKLQTNKYHCKHCGKITERLSNKKWINSFCTTAGYTTRLWRMDKNYKMTEYPFGRKLQNQ